MGQRVTQLELKISTRVCFSIICYPLEGRFAYFPGRIYNQSLYTWMCPFFAVSKIQIVVRWPILSPTEKWNFCIDIVALKNGLVNFDRHKARKITLLHKLLAGLKYQNSVILI